MHIKHFRAETLDAALKLVKNELGPDALVLQTRKIRPEGGIQSLIGKPLVEVVAAADPKPVQAQASPRRESPQTRADAMEHRVLDPLRSELKELRTAISEIRSQSREDDGLRREIRALRGAISEIVHASEDRDAGPTYSLMRAFGLAPDHARSLENAAQALGRESNQNSEACAQDALARILDPRIELARPDDRKRVSLFVGAPGVGKTTSLAKLAARSADLGGRGVIISTDTERAESNASLERLSERLGFRFASVRDPAEVSRQIRSWDRHIWIDTAGRGRRDSGSLSELMRIRDQLGAETRVHLVLAATTQEQSMRSQLQRYSVLEPDSLIVAKFDETDSFGSFANVLLDPTTPGLRWLGNGQRIPEDLLIPEPEELAARILGGSA